MTTNHRLPFQSGTALLEPLKDSYGIRKRLRFQAFSPLVQDKTTWPCLYPSDMATKSIQGGRSQSHLTGWSAWARHRAGGLNFFCFLISVFLGCASCTIAKANCSESEWPDISVTSAFVAPEFSQRSYHTREMHMENVSWMSLRHTIKMDYSHLAKIQSGAWWTLFGNL